MIAGLDAKRYDMVANEVAVRPERLEKNMICQTPTLYPKLYWSLGKNNNDIKTLDDLKREKKVGQSLDSNYRKNCGRAWCYKYSSRGI
ncbi:hypothetical protein GCM10020331_020680 [Ectobacillus funiculus]